MRVLSTALAVTLVVGSMAACGGSTAVNFYDGAAGNAGTFSNAAGAGAAGSLASAGQAASVGGSGGASVASGGHDSPGAAGSPSAAGSTNSSPSDTPCSPVVDGMGGLTGPFGSTGPYCLRVSGDIVGWGCSNFQGRTVKVNGQPVMCAQLPLPDKLQGDYYFDISAGDVTYASLFWY